MVIETVAEVATLWIVVTLITVTAFRKRDGTPIVEPLSGYELASELEKSSWIYPSGGWSNKADFEIEAPNMYKDREPRFYVTVFFGGSQFIAR